MAKMWTYSADLRTMSRRQFPEKLAAFTAESHIDIAPVLLTVFPFNEILRSQTVNESDGAMVSNLELIGQFADCHAFPLRETFDGK